ncbi:SNF2 family N-terminal domain-containing protein [Xylariaceae sp. AK1471]|nr:SNF2 family N-terminal domain-containing protein [Xylariaceae sp. AK1471]
MSSTQFTSMLPTTVRRKTSKNLLIDSDNKTDEIICFGALTSGKALLLTGQASPTALGLEPTNAKFRHLQVSPKAHYCVICHEDTEFACLDIETSKKLKTVAAMTTISYDAVVGSDLPMKRSSKGTKGQFDVSLNLYGPRSAGQEVADALCGLSIFLQHPWSVKAGIQYDNPQFFKTPTQSTMDIQNFMDNYIGVGTQTGWATKVGIYAQIHNILDTLNFVPGSNASIKPGVLRSKLKPHQEAGFSFIALKESQLRHDAQSRLRTHTRSIITPTPLQLNFGGLIADAMGLGKTLTMLSAIAFSRADADSYGQFYDTEDSTTPVQSPIKATLIVVSSVQLLDVWISEIDSHFMPHYFEVLKFHGSSRPKEPDALRPYDIIITTYATLAADYTADGVLHKVTWFRVVLDEAHWIRNSGTGQFHAAEALLTKKRWCLTGTPIMNNLSDLSSLAVFMKLDPIYSKSDFTKYIGEPLYSGRSDSASALREYLENYCLRRSSAVLSLPASTSQTVPVAMSPEERDIYIKIFQQVRIDMDNLTSKGVRAGRYNLLFTAMQKARMLCNNGTLWTPQKLTVERLTPHQIIAECQRCSPDDEDNLFLLGGFEFCPDCSRPISQRIPSPPSHSPAPILSPTRLDSSLVTLSPGVSSKINALVNAIINCGDESKHLIFSSWTSTLDLLSQSLATAGISSVQIDGRSDSKDRAIRLQAFQETTQFKVLLMSIGTGAVGLTLTAANYVHIVEPQWNPFVEEQAVGRASRIGQTRQVTVFRYIAADTVEQNLLDLQQKKRNLARFTFDGSRDDKAVGIDDIEAVIGKVIPLH